LVFYVHRHKVQNDRHFGTRHLYGFAQTRRLQLLQEALDKMKKEVLEQGIMQEREKTIMYFYYDVALSAQQIADTLAYHVQYVQSVIDKFEKGK
jgi:DNA-directed RNA polymerase specialized sigma subunit